MENTEWLKKLKEFKKYVKNFLKHHKESIEEIHELRVICRELFSLLQSDEPFSKIVKKVIKTSNKVRDIDVFSETYLKSLPKKYLKKMDTASIINSVNERRKKEIDKLHHYLKTLVVPESAEFHHEIQEMDMMNSEEVKLDKEELHVYRIYIKKILFIEKNSSSKDEKKIKTLSKIKDILGTINDNYNGVKELSSFDIQDKLLKKIEKFTQKQNLKLFKQFKDLNQKVNKGPFMKKLYIIRHAKSSWKESSLDDFERPLNKRGKADAPLMGSKLKEKRVMPDLILSSPALRAKTTAEIITKKIEFEKEIVFDENIYESSVNELHKIVSEIDDENRVVFLFGHNPSLNELAQKYINLNENIPTCGIVEIEFDCDSWTDISAKNARLLSFDYPKKEK
ncbi:CHAD domain-containing protein [bacterium]|nr:CHAD domain-containing protein [bacterium]MBU1995198.1 CHAD domain-containing protein [bacterium]